MEIVYFSFRHGTTQLCLRRAVKFQCVTSIIVFKFAKNILFYADKTSIIVHAAIPFWLENLGCQDLSLYSELGQITEQPAKLANRLTSQRKQRLNYSLVACAIIPFPHHTPTPPGCGFYLIRIDIIIRITI